MTTTVIHVNQHHIKHNRKHPDAMKPVLTVKNGRGNYYTDAVRILGGSTIVYRPDTPLSCGAHVWIETEQELYFPEGYMTFDETKEIV